MPFGLSNAPAMFQAIVNQIFEPMLWRFVIIFFNDLLIYNQSREDHLLHLEEVFSTLRQHTFFIRESKCMFGLSRLAYLEHIISITRI